MHEQLEKKEVELNKIFLTQRKHLHILHTYFQKMLICRVILQTVQLCIDMSYATLYVPTFFCHPPWGSIEFKRKIEISSHDKERRDWNLHLKHENHVKMERDFLYQLSSQ